MFTVVVDGAGAGAADAVEAHAAAARPASYQARVSADRVAVVSELGRARFQVVNMSLAMAREPAEVGAGDPNVIVRAADRDRDGAVVGIAERGFWASRFHLDPRIPARVANRIKADWAANCLAGDRGDELLVAERDGSTAGFLAVIRGESRGVRSQTIDLVAVDPDRRGCGIGAALVQRFLSDAAGACDVVRVGTQAANVPATRFYERLGFVAAEAAYDLHLHAGDPVWPA